MRQFCRGDFKSDTEPSIPLHHYIQLTVVLDRQKIIFQSAGQHVRTEGQHRPVLGEQKKIR